MKTKKKANQVKRYYSVTFNDSNETIINPKGCITEATPIILNEYEGKKGQEVMVAQYDLAKAKMNEYRINRDTTVTQEKALTKAELVKLYEEFVEETNKKHEEELNRYYRYQFAQNIKDNLQIPQQIVTHVDVLRMGKKLKKSDVLGAISKAYADEPRFKKPTFNEFMESLGEKPESHNAGSFVNYYRLSEAERAGLLTETN